MSVVLAAAVYLPAARCFALVPLISSVRRSGRPEAAALDYDADRESVTVTAGAEYRCCCGAIIALTSAMPLASCLHSGQQRNQHWHP